MQILITHDLVVFIIVVINLLRDLAPELSFFSKILHILIIFPACNALLYRALLAKLVDSNHFEIMFC